MNHDNVGRMIFDDQIFTSFKTSKELFSTALYPLKYSSKIRQFGVYIFVLTCFAAECHWAKNIWEDHDQYGETPTDEQVSAMD